MKNLIQGYLENGMQQVAAGVAEATIRNATQTPSVTNGKKGT